MLDAKGLAETTGLLVKSYVQRALSPVLERLAAVEARKPDKGEPGEKGLDGKDGADGRDGLGFDDLDVIHDGERGFTFRFTQGERAKEFPFSLPVVIDRGVFKDGSEYERGDGTTFAGSFWIAQKDTVEKPGSGDDWRLAVKRGRDGKDKG